MSPPPEVTAVAVAERSWLRAVGPHALIVLALAALTIQQHFRLEYALLTLFWASLTFTGPRARRFAGVALPILLVGVLYEQVVPRLLPYRPEVHVASVYNLELALFGVPAAAEGGRVILSEWFASRTHPVVDFLCGFAYIAYMYETFLVVALLYIVRDEERSLRLSWAFLGANVIGMATWIAFPVAPPWYVAQYGLGPALHDVPASAAGAARFDALIGYPFFATFYSKSQNVHGAMPSLHTAYPVVVAFWLWTKGAWARWSTIAFAALVGFAAVYLYHHYLVDVLAGAAAALIACVLVEWFRRDPDGTSGL
jgi:inositol phosphorylceramide synthase catalytic subunit